MKNIANQKFGKLTAINAVGKESGGLYIWLCKCDCGAEALVNGKKLRRGITKSCGCLTVYRNNFRHGYSHTKEHNTWIGMRQRCSNENNKRFKDYGGRGISVCDRWKNSFENFIKDMGYAPTPKHTLERINVNGGYEPTNCKWATIKEQANNKTVNVFVDIDGVIKTVKQWSEKLNVSQYSVRSRISRGWDAKKAIVTPFRKISNSKKGNTKCL